MPSDVFIEARDSQDPPPEPAITRRRRMQARIRRGRQFLDLGFYLLYGLILLQIALEALGARDAAGFKQFLDTVTAPALAPFENLFSTPQIANHQIMLSYIAALLVFLMLQGAINRVIRIILRQR